MVQAGRSPHRISWLQLRLRHISSSVALSLSAYRPRGDVFMGVDQLRTLTPIDLAVACEAGMLVAQERRYDPLVVSHEGWSITQLMPDTAT